MRIAVVGSRGWVDHRPIRKAFEAMKPPIVIVSGGAEGVDQIASHFAAVFKFGLVEYLPDYGKHGRSAPLVRNRQIVDDSDEVVAFWDGRSRGTKYTIDYARKQGKPVKIYSQPPKEE